jgi:putative oligomerization/nucleic acid binding protein
MPMMGRRRGPGLVRVAATTAVVAGTATAVSGHVANKQQAKAQEQQQQAAEQQAAQTPPEPEAAPAETGEDETLATIEKLAAMRDKGIITDEEFAAKKA